MSRRIKRPGYRLVHKLYRMAFAIEKTAGQLRDVGNDGHARALDAAARACSDAARDVEAQVVRAISASARGAQ